MSGIATGTALLIGAGVSGAAAVGGAALSSSAAGKAASTQSTAAMDAAQLQYKASQDSLAFQNKQYDQGQANLQPWLNSGSGALSNLNYLLGNGANPNAQTGGTGTYQPIGVQGVRPMTGNTMQQGNGLDQPINAQSGATPAIGGQIGSAPGGVQATSGAQPATGMRPVSSVPAAGGTGATSPNGGSVNTANGAYGSLMQPYGEQFTAPTGLTEQNDPGYQARLKLGTDSIERSAAARGGVLTGGTAKALTSYGQDYGSNEYGNVYGRALSDYTTKYNAYNNNQTNQYNRLASMAGVGQQAAGQLATQGQNASNNVSSNLLGTASAIGQQTNNAAAANASGIVGSANAWGGALGNTGNNLSQLLLMKQLYGSGSGGYGGPSTGGGGALPTGWA